MADNDIQVSITIQKYVDASLIREFTGIQDTTLTDSMINLAIDFGLVYTRNQFPEGYFDSLPFNTKKILVSLAASQVLLKNKIAGTLHQKINSYSLGHVSVPKSPIEEKLNSLHDMYIQMVNAVRPTQAVATTSQREVIFSDGIPNI
jgi:hypothetical protein